MQATVVARFPSLTSSADTRITLVDPLTCFPLSDDQSQRPQGSYRGASARGR